MNDLKQIEDALNALPPAEQIALKRRMMEAMAQTDAEFVERGKQAKRALVEARTKAALDLVAAVEALKTPILAFNKSEVALWTGVQNLFASDTMGDALGLSLLREIGALGLHTARDQAAATRDKVLLRIDHAKG